MSTRRDTLIFALLVLFSLAAAIALAVRNQKTIEHPQSNLWPTLASCKVKTHYLNMNYSIHCPTAVLALAGQPVTVDGFMLPLEASANTRHFLLSIRSPSCPYCPPGSPNEIIEIFMATPVKATDQLVHLRGHLQFETTESVTGIFFRIEDATFTAAPATPAPHVLAQYHFKTLGAAPAQQTTLAPWLGKPFLISFWRSDCAPCLKELAALPALARAHPATPIVLIALDDTAPTLPPLPANVHSLLAEADARTLLNAFGNDRALALPYSVMMDANGVPCGKRFGILAATHLQQWHTQCTH